MAAYDRNEQTRTITARNLDAAKQKLYAQFQDRYEITNKRPVLYGGVLGLFQHDGIEVSYVVKERGRSLNFSDVYSRPVSMAQNSFQNKDEDSFSRNQEELLRRIQNDSGQSVSSIQINELVKKLDSIEKKIDEKPQVISTGVEEHPSISKIEELLEQNEFTPSYIKKITAKIKSIFPLDDLDDFDRVQRQVVDWIGESINVAKTVVHRKPRTVIIVGPTGVGKTTTLVKLAAQNVKEAKNCNRMLKMCFITTDTMRVGAYEQLSRFGTLFDLEVKKAERAEDVKQIYEQEKDFADMIFIDTSGYSPNDATHIGAMKKTLDVPGMNPEVYLAVSASTKARDLKNIMQNYEPFGYKSVIITKCDESNQYGNVISVLEEKNKSISYITNGQRAAGCIEKPNVVDFLIRLEDFYIDRIHIEDKFGVN